MPAVLQQNFWVASWVAFAVLMDRSHGQLMCGEALRHVREALRQVKILFCLVRPVAATCFNEYACCGF
jgi:hypothetical protein